MPFLPPAQFGLAKKRMRNGLHPAVIAAVNNAMADTGLRAQRGPDTLYDTKGARYTPNAGARRQVDAGVGHSARGDYAKFLQQDPEGDVRELHVYNQNGKRQVMAFHPGTVDPQLQARLNPTAKQHLSNSATAEDKLLAMAARQVAMGGALAQRVGSRRRFSRNPGPIKYLARP